MENPGAGTKTGVNKIVKPIYVILADDHTLVRAGIRALLEKLPGVKVIGEAGDGREALNLVRAQPPEVVLLDIAMPGLNGLEAAERLARDFPAVRVIILTMHDNEEYVRRALKAGAVGYLLKKSATAELETALHEVMRGEIYLCREIAAQLNKKFPLSGLVGRKSALEQLTGRQREVLQLIAEGNNTKGIGDILKVSPKTVEYHRMKLMAGLKLHDIPGLVRFALRVGLIPEEKLAAG
jgi:DNA-binding NarL/FixJ family response regulator